MRTFMLGWEFPPHISGGLGTACYGLTKAMSELGAEIVFVLPRPVCPTTQSHVRFAAQSPTMPAHESIVASNAPGASAPPSSAASASVSFRAVDVEHLSPYQAPAQYLGRHASAPSGAGEGGRETPSPVVFSFRAGTSSSSSANASMTQTTTPAAHREAREQATLPASGSLYAGDMFREVDRYAALAWSAARYEAFDVIHAHDWMTFPAGVSISQLTGKPLVTHVHSTEFDRSGMHVNERIYQIERMGMTAATRVIAVSELTRQRCINQYGVPPGKVDVVYNSVDLTGYPATLPPMRSAPVDTSAERPREKTVLFFGRITLQKGPEYFLAAARKVLSVMQDVRFVVAGNGDMTRRVVQMAADMGIGSKVHFTGFLSGTAIDRVFAIADVYVMPSVSEPFGIAPLEAIRSGVPVIISRTSGVSEVLANALKVDFWDINEMANKIVAVLRHPALGTTLRAEANREIRRWSWTDAARNCLDVYRNAIGVLRKAA